MNNGADISVIKSPTGASKGYELLSPEQIVLLISILVVAGSYSLLPIWVFMSRVWIQDPLRSVGSIFPAVAFVGTVVAWRRIGWEINGSFWGLPLLTLSIVLARATTSLNLIFRIHQQNHSLLHPGLVMLLYGAGAALLFGGTRLLRVAIAPLCLLLLINPVPYAYSAAVDLPLQFLSANTARHFAHLIGLQPSGLQLRMMFTPHFGMMIVPGCDGVRGSVTLGYLALIFGYTQHLRPRVLALTALGAFLMGYVLNLMRLCMLVVYYKVGITHESMQHYGVWVDYAIGCTLFLFAAFVVGFFIRWIATRFEEQKKDASAESNSANTALKIGYGTPARIVCFLLLTLAFILPALARGDSLRIGLPNEQALLSSFPSQVGVYRLTRTYAEHDSNGIVQFVLADYAIPTDRTGVSSQITLGLYTGLGMHLVASSRFAQGLRPEWISFLDTVDGSIQQPLTVHYVTTVYDDGIRREYDAESACYETGCYANVNFSSAGLLVAPKISDLFSAANDKRLPILIRREWPDNDSTPQATQQSKFENDAQQFTQRLNLRMLLRADGTSY